MADQAFPKGERIRTRAEIDRVFKAGARFSCKGMRLHVLANSLAVNRAVFVPVRSYPNAVARNRAKRLLRECWRLGKEGLTARGYDCVVVLFPGKDDLGERSTQLARLLLQAGMVARAR